MILEIVLHPFTWGLIPGLLLAAFAGLKVRQAQRELQRFRRHLSERLELEADSIQGLRAAKTGLEKENEQLRMKVSQLNQEPGRQAQRQVEILLRAERRVLVAVPGFAAAWEDAKHAAQLELEAEEAGHSMPRRVISRLLGRHPSVSIEDSSALPHGDGRRTPS